MLSQKQNIENKQRVREFLNRIAESDLSDLSQNLERAYHPEAELRASHPFNEIQGTRQIESDFWKPLITSFPDLERRDQILVGGEYQDQIYVATIGHYSGTFEKNWIGIPPTGGWMQLRYGEVHRIKEKKIMQSTVLLDVADAIRQAGFSFGSDSLGSEITWAGPITADGILLDEQNPEEGEASLAQTLAMHKALADFDDLKNLTREELLNMPQKQYWHPKMMWYGPSGIGTARGLKGFVECHQLPFRRALPNRLGGQHYIRIGDGKYSVTGGWPSVTAIHVGGDWLGLPATGKSLGMRVMDFYHHHEGLIRENWVPIDMLHIYCQMGVDILERLRYENRYRFPE